MKKYFKKLYEKIAKMHRKYGDDIVREPELMNNAKRHKRLRDIQQKYPNIDVEKLVEIEKRF